MFKSKEIRWFTESRDPGILDWFRLRARTFEKTRSRVDYYLPLQKNDISVKLREGNIEVKHRVGDGTPTRLTDRVEGVFENWIKWSFKVDKVDRLKTDIIHFGKYEWLKMTKKRMGIKVATGNPNPGDLYDIAEFVDFGCQIEYTEVELLGSRYYSFGLEWFGEKFIELEHEFLEELLGKSILSPEQSKGYCQFIMDRQNI
jgi:hypothetical protein